MFLPPSSATVELLFKEKENKNINKSDKKEIAKDARLNLKKKKTWEKFRAMILYKCEMFYPRKKDSSNYLLKQRVKTYYQLSFDTLCHLHGVGSSSESDQNIWSRTSSM